MGCEETKEKLEVRIGKLLQRQKDILRRVEQEEKKLEGMGYSNEVNNKALKPTLQLSAKSKKKGGLSPAILNHQGKEYYQCKNDYLSVAIADERGYEGHRRMKNLSSESFDFQDISPVDLNDD